VAELAVRAAGYRPRVEISPSRTDPLVHQPDPVIGWRAKSGTYLFAPYHEGGAAVRMTIWPDGSRATEAQPRERPGAPLVTLLGDSFTMGWAISDDETWAWKLQARFPGVTVRNFGTAGYNTHQATLRLAAAHRETGLSPTVVLYGFGVELQHRNVADSVWLKMLESSRRGHIAVPYCVFGPDGFACHPPLRYAAWPLASWSAAVNLLADGYDHAHDRARLRRSKAVTEQLLTRLDESTRAMGGTLVVVLLDPRAKPTYGWHLRSAGIRHVDCVDPGAAVHVVPHDNHPDGRANSYWAGCVADAIR
jgi:hypothetical protein